MTTESPKNAAQRDDSNGTSLNNAAALKNRKNTIIAASVIGILMISGAILMLSHENKSAPRSALVSTNIEGFESIANYSKSATTAAIGTLQDSTTQTRSHVEKLQKEDAELESKYQDLSQELHDLKSDDTTRSPYLVGNMQTPINNGGFSDFNANYPKPEAPHLASCRPNNCVLPGTFVKAVLLGGADADASVEGQSNTTPILFRILGAGTLPNGYHVNLKGCFVVGEVYGDISSQRGEVKLTQISCVRDSRMISTKINGIADDIGGKEGIRGIPVYKAGTMLALSGFSGFLSGFGNAVSQSYSTQTTSPIGTTTTPDTGHLFQIGAASGFGDAANNLSNFYIKLANQYHPIIQINAGAMVDLVFLSEFTLDDGVNGGAAVSHHLSNGYWQSDSSAVPSQEGVSLGSVLNPSEVATVSQQMKNLGGGES